MNDITSLFFELIRVAIGNQACLSHSPSAEEWGGLYAMAKKQSLLGICFAGVQKTLSGAPFHSTGSGQVPGENGNIPDSLFLQWMGMAAKVQQRNEVLNRQCAELQAKLSDCGMRSAILKGQGIASLYTISDEGLNINDLSGLRQSGDIDVYVDCGREKAIEYARSMQDEVDWDYKHLHLKMFTDTEVEVHYRPEVLMNLRKNARLQRWFEEHKEMMFRSSTCSGNGTAVLVTPSVEFNLFYILLHIYRHFLFEGVGLRQLMDYYFVLKTLSDSPLKGDDVQIAKNAISDFGMSRFAKGIMWIMQEVFGLKQECMLYSADEKEGRYILREVMEGGNFGHHDERIAVNVSGKKGSVLRILRHNWHLLAHYPSEALWAPIYFVWHYFWKKVNG